MADYRLLAPILSRVGVRHKFGDLVEFADDVAIQRISDSDKDGTAFEALSRRQTIDLRTATHSFVVSLPSLSTAAKQEGQSYIIYASMALWLAAPAGVNYELRIAQQRSADGSWLWRGHDIYNPLVPLPEYEDVAVDEGDLRLAKKLFDRLLCLSDKGACALARNSLWLALAERRVSLRYLILWIAGETLFGPDQERAEIGHQLAERIALFLKSAVREREELYQEVKRLYSYRSKVIHGREVTSGTRSEERMKMTHRLEMIIRDSLVKSLLDEEVADIMNSMKRDIFLRNQVFY